MVHVNVLGLLLLFGSGYDFIFTSDGVNAMRLCDSDPTVHTVPFLSTSIPLGKVPLDNLYSLT